jgi:hypothetical protein
MGSESRKDTWKQSSRRRSKRSDEQRNSPHRNISPTGLDSMDKRKTHTRTIRKTGKLDHNHERAHITPHNEPKHHNDDQTRAEVVISRLRTEYTRATHSAVMDKEPRPECPFCALNITTQTTFYGIVRKRK